MPPEDDFWKVVEVAEGQDRVLLLAFLHTAARRGELYRLTWSDVDFGNQRLQLTTRKRKDGSLERDYIPMTDMVAIQEILRHRKLATTERYVRGLEPVRPYLRVLEGRFSGQRSNDWSNTHEKGLRAVTS